MRKLPDACELSGENFGGGNSAAVEEEKEGGFNPCSDVHLLTSVLGFVLWIFSQRV